MIGEIKTETVHESILQGEEKQGNDVLIDNHNKDTEKRFITSPTDSKGHRKVNLQDMEISEEHQKQFRNVSSR